MWNKINHGGEPTKNVDKKYAIFVGRYQPYHFGHIELIKQKLNEGIPALIMVRNIEPDERNPFTTEQTVSMIKKYLTESREKLAKGKDHNNIFVSTHGKQISRHSFWHRIKAYLQRVDVKKEVHPHTLRHAFATHMLNNGADLRVVQLLLGHSDLNTTQIYTEVARQRLKRLHTEHHPRG